jgi:hypothetical protein
MKASYLFKQNITALLRARGNSQHDLAWFCLRSDAWLSKILGKGDRNLPMKYLDKFADFFGIAPYQLFQPGITPLAERRKNSERRSGRDRRISQVVANRVLGGRGIEEPILAALASDELDLVRKFRALSADEREHLQKVAVVAREPRSDGAKTAPLAARQATGGRSIDEVPGRARRGQRA